MPEEHHARFRLKGVAEFWLPSPPEADRTGPLSYRPAVMVECKVNFRSLRAGLNHSDERNYTAWVPEGDSDINWDTPAADVLPGGALKSEPDPGIPYREGGYAASLEDFYQWEHSLIDLLVRTERLRLFFTPVFGLFSGPDDPIEQFLARVGEAALGRVEPELKQLRIRFELHLEQIRQAHAARGSADEQPSFENIISDKLRLFESENRLAGMFSTLAGSVFGTTGHGADSHPVPPAHNAEMNEELNRVEEEASKALRSLYEEYMNLANEYDTFEIGLRPENIQIQHRLILWVPVGTGDGPGREDPE